MTAHAALGASNSHIWLNCTGSYALSLGRERKATVHTRAGSACHQISEDAILTGQLPPSGETVTIDGEDVVVDDEMLDGALFYAAQVNAIKDIAEWNVVEGRFSLDDLWESGEAPLPLFGTADFTAVLGRVLYVMDLKYGKGKIVDAEGNSQLLYYATGAWLLLRRENPDLAAKIDRVVLSIVQPRAPGDKVKTWAIPILDLLLWAYGTLKPTVEKIHRGETELVSGSHCFFCVAAPICPRLHEAKVQRAAEAFPDCED